MINFQYVKATSQKAAIDALVKDPAAQFIAGGTNLVDLMKRGVTAPLSNAMAYAPHRPLPAAPR